MKTSHTYIIVIAVLLALTGCTGQSLETRFNSQETAIANYASGVKFIRCQFVPSVDDEGNPILNNDGSQAYIKENLDTLTPSAHRHSGATRLTIVQGEGEPLSETGTATIHYAGYVFTSGPSSIDYTEVSLDGGDPTWLLATPYTAFTISSSADGLTIGGTGTSSGLSIFGTNHYGTAMLSGWSLSEGDYSPMTVDLGSGDLIDGLQAGLPGVRAGEVCDILFSGRYGLGKRPLGTIPANSALLFRVWVVSVSE